MKNRNFTSPFLSKLLALTLALFGHSYLAQAQGADFLLPSATLESQLTSDKCRPEIACWPVASICLVRLSKPKTGLAF